MHMAGTEKPHKMEVLSATAPITRGITAPPSIAVTIRPESSLEYSGILSIAMENMSGNILPNPKAMITRAIKAAV